MLSMTVEYFISCEKITVNPSKIKNTAGDAEITLSKVLRKKALQS